MSENIHIDGREIAIKSVNDQDYISLTDIAKQRNSENPSGVISQWLGNRDTEDFLELWERLHNSDFKPSIFASFKDFRHRKGTNPRVKEYIEHTGAIGIISKSGRYGGTFANTDIAFEFASYVSPYFKLQIITEFQRLRSEEVQKQKIQWNAGRELARLNYPLQTAAIAETTGSVSEKKKPGYYAQEADLINRLIFGITAKEWRIKNPDAKGNIRDNASTEENILIANLESFNSQLIRKGASEEARERALADMIEFQRKILNQKYLPE